MTRCDPPPKLAAHAFKAAAEDREGKRGREHQKHETKHAVVNIEGWSLFFWYCNSDATGFLSQQVHNACRERSARTAIAVPPFTQGCGIANDGHYAIGDV
jgi:hypothetical protein